MADARIAARQETYAMESAMQLYFSPGACSLASHIALREAGLPFDLKRTDVKTKKLEDGSDYFAINSKGAVPALRLDDGQVLTEGLGDPAVHRGPEARVTPRAEERHARRYRLQEWLNFITSECTRASRRCSIRPPTRR